MTTFAIETYLQERKAQVEAALRAYLQRMTTIPPRLVEAMEYSLMAGGKRLRPILTLAGAEAVGGTATSVMPCACALEMIHTFSLIHDDLPAMDNDDLRRGRPTNHKVFGDGLAILAGDGLLAEAFWCLTDLLETATSSPARVVQVIREIAAATGGRGMTGGQVLDLAAEHRTLQPAEVEQLHAYKTGALLRVAVTSGACLAGADDVALARLRRYGEAIGLAFQIADDLLAIEGDPALLGKRVGNDLEREKATYPAMAGVEAARATMTRCIAEAMEQVQPLGDAARPLTAIAEYVIARRS